MDTTNFALSPSGMARKHSWPNQAQTALTLDNVGSASQTVDQHWSNIVLTHFCTVFMILVVMFVRRSTYYKAMNIFAQNFYQRSAKEQFIKWGKICIIALDAGSWLRPGSRGGGLQSLTDRPAYNHIKMIDLYVILAMPFNSFLVVVIYIIEVPSFYFGNAT